MEAISENIIISEEYDIVDIHGNKLGYSKNNMEHLTENEYQIGASLWIVNPHGKLLIQRRAPTKRIGANLWSITGGKVKTGENSVDACLREAFEEIGLVLTRSDIVFLYRSLGKNMLFDDFITNYNSKFGRFTLKSSEVSEIKWVSFEEIIRMHSGGEFLYNDISDISIVKEYVNNLMNS